MWDDITCIISQLLTGYSVEQLGGCSQILRSLQGSRSYQVEGLGSNCRIY